MKRIALILLAFPLVAFAQQPPTDPRIEATITELVRGRDAALSALMNEQASLRAELTLLRKELEAAKKECKPAEEKK